MRRIRRTPEAVRDEALAVARQLLLDEGPGAITLKTVAGQLGMTHANLLHHFGTADGLQTALVERMARDVTQQVADVVQRVRSGEATHREIVDVVFDAFDRGGGGRLVAWLVLLGKTHEFAPLFAAIRDLLAAVEAGAAETVENPRQMIIDMALGLILPALGNGLLGPLLAEALGAQPHEARRVVTEDMIRRAESYTRQD